MVENLNFITWFFEEVYDFIFYNFSAFLEINNS